MLQKRGKRAAVLLSLVLFLSSFTMMPSWADSTTASIATAGKVMLLGGAMEDDNAEVYNALREAAGGGTPRIAVICSASPSYEDAVHVWSVDDPGSVSYQHLFQNYGFEPVFVPVTIDTYTTESYKQENVDLINSCDAVFFNGGWQERHTRCMFEDDGTATPVFNAVKALYQRGGIVSGTSAGCAIMGAITYGDGNSYGYLKANHMIEKQITDVNTADPNDPNNGGYVKGFGFTEPYDALTDSHFMAEGRFARPIVAMRELGKSIAIGVDENTGFLLSNDTGKVYGENGVTIFDGAGAAFMADTYFVASNVLVSYLTSGDAYNFGTKTVLSSKPVVNPNERVYNSNDIFKAYEASKVMVKLVRSSSLTALGFSKEKNPRFLVTFTKTDSTKGYYDPASQKGTVDKVNVSITYQQK